MVWHIVYVFGGVILKIINMFYCFMLCLCIILSISTILTIITTTVTSRVLASGPPAHCTRPHVLPTAALGGGCDHPHLRHEEAEVAEQTRSAAPPTHLPAPLLPRG